LHLVERKLAAALSPEIWRDLSVVVAVSGGPDSVALLRGMAGQAEPSGAARLVVAHYNHRWRGEESDADESFVRDLCSKLGVVCQVGRAESDRPTTLGDGLESAAREARYAFLTAAARQCGARYVAVAHTADDQAETVLHRVLRGTGLAGLAGMPRCRPLCEGVTLVRPLLDVRREEVLAYLTSLGQDFRHDESNLDSTFTRVRIRRELLPQLRAEYNPQVDDALLRLARLAGEAQGVIDDLVAKLAARAISERGGESRIDCAALGATPRYLVRELLVSLWKSRGCPQQAMSFDRWEELAAMALDAAPVSASRDLPGGVRVARVGSVLVCSNTSKIDPVD
jgi:tRNA(Ile)-lysidine synthase